MSVKKKIFQHLSVILLTIFSVLKINTGIVFSEDIDQLINNSVEAFQNVSDYTCKLDKTVNKNGRIYKDPFIFVKYKKPTHYYFRWEHGRFKGQEVIFVSGRNNDKISQDK